MLWDILVFSWIVCLFPLQYIILANTGKIIYRLYIHHHIWNIPDYQRKILEFEIGFS